MGVRQNSYSEAARHLCAVFQTGKPVQEYELNEAQSDILNFAASGTKHSSGSGIGDTIPTLSSPGANQLQVSAAKYVVDGLYVDQTTAVTITGLTTPGAPPRVDNLYLEVQVSEVDDPAPLTPLGVTSRRKKLIVSFKVAEGAAVPASTGRLLDGGIQRLPLYQISRTGSTNPLAGSQTPKYTLLPTQVFAQILTVSDGSVQKLVAGVQGLLDTPASVKLGFHDGIMAPSRVNLTDAVDASGGLLLGAAEEKATVNSNLTSVLRKINGRAFITCGNGSTSFGDFNGADAPIQALTAFWTAYPDYPVTLFLKRGQYALSSQITCLGPLKLVGESARGSGTGLVDGVILSRAGVVISSTFALELENVRLEGSGKTVTHVGGTNNAYLRVIRSEIVGGISYTPVGGSDEPGLLIDDSSVIGAGPSTGEPIALSVTVGVIPRVVIRNSYVSAASLGSGLISFGRSTAGNVDASRLAVEGCHLVLSSNTDSTSPQITTGLIKFYDSASIQVTVDAITFVDCFIQAQDGPWWNLCPGKGDGGATYNTASSIDELSFVRCTLSTSSGYADGEMFSYRARTGVTWPDRRASSVSFDRCLFDLQSTQVGLNPELSGTGDKAVVMVRAHRVSMRDCVFSGGRDGIFSSAAASTNYSAWIHLNPIEHVTADAVDYGEVNVDGLSFQGIAEVGAGTTATAALSVQSADIATRVNIRRVQAAPVGAVAKFAYMIQVIALSSHIAIHDCDQRSNYQEAGIDCRPYAGAGSAQVISVERNSLQSVKGPQYVSSSFDYSVVSVRGNRVLAGGTTASEEGMSLSATGNGSVLDVSANSVYGFDSYGMSLSGGHVTLTGNMCRANNSGGVQARVVAATTVSAFGNVCATSGGVVAGLDLTPAVASPAASTHYGADTRDVNTLGTFTNNGDMRFNFAKLVH